MSALRFQLFGQFGSWRDDQPLKGIAVGKEQELLCYLLIQRDRCHSRESLASVLWADNPTERSKKYLRQALWHLQAALSVGKPADEQILTVDHTWVQLNLPDNASLDVSLFEHAFNTTHGIPAGQLGKDGAQLLKDAVAVYKQDLLDGWYDDWVLFERERLQNMYLIMLDKLVIHSHEQREYEAGQAYGAAILRFDRARERTHRQLMHLLYLAGDRTAALRQYDRCVIALREELGIKPERRTTALYEQIRSDRVGAVETSEHHANAANSAPLREVLGRLKRLHLRLGNLQKRLREDIATVEQGLKAEEVRGKR
jgi:DNA-binding SARP family transcriptional activator